MKLLQIERPFIAYSLCFDDVMRTYLQHRGIPYSQAFGCCWEFEYDSSIEDMARAVRFPSVGYRKYESIGITIDKRAIEDREIAFNDILSLIQAGEVVPLHFDGYYCPWDTLQKIRRWHNLHTVLIHGIDKKRRNWIVDDPFYSVSNKKVPISALGTACKFYFRIDISNYKEITSDESYQAVLPKFLKLSPIRNLERFLRDLKKKGRANTPGWIFDSDWQRMVDNGYMTRHYLWLFFHNLHSETKSGYYGMLELLFFSDLQLWKECVIHSLKGARRKDKSERFGCFLETFTAVIEKEKEISDVLKSGKVKENAELISTREIGNIKDYRSVKLVPLFNARACKRSRRDTKSADITGEGEYIIPRKKYFDYVPCKNIPFQVWFGEAADHLRCDGQEMIIEGSRQWKGIAFLVCSEWGCSQFLIRMLGEQKDYFSDCIISDYTNPSANSIRIGKSFLRGGKKDVLYQKNIYLQYVYFEFPSDDCIKKIIMPKSHSSHVFSAVLVR